MTLEQYVKAEQDAAKENGKVPPVLTILERLADAAGVSVMTLKPVVKGATMGLFDKALAVSKATGYQVSVPELCMRFPDQAALIQFQALAKVLSNAPT